MSRYDQYSETDTYELSTGMTVTPRFLKRLTEGSSFEYASWILCISQVEFEEVWMNAFYDGEDIERLTKDRN